MTIQIVSVDSVMLYFEPTISEEVLDKVQSAYTLLKKLEGVIDITPSYNSILIHYDIYIYNYQTIQETIIEALERTQQSFKKSDGKLITIPTNYNGVDLESVAKTNNLTIDEVITLHTQTIYRVYAIGFMVGFAYLAKVNPQIATPRLNTPRAKVPKGSVAIADNQTAIYHQESAGGWNIIGHTEFDAFEQFAVGDRVQFVRV
ncbi:MAG: allophanate hydrolase subunit 1 [Epsilonproteobacteria bacterium]|nr:allophanate hydrolase subunit 1 [Campylobacterota bacterium]